MWQMCGPNMYREAIFRRFPFMASFSIPPGHDGPWRASTPSPQHRSLSCSGKHLDTALPNLSVDWVADRRRHWEYFLSCGR